MFEKDELRTARKEYQCDLCGAKIKVGDKYHRLSGVYDNDFYDVKECLACQPVIKEFCKSNDFVYDEGYNEKDVREWWQQEKCPKCKRYYYLPCDPIDWCNERDVNNCIFRTKDGKCKEEHCEKMTHYCRCENFEEKEE